MKLNIYVIYDKDNKQAGELFTALSDQQAQKRLIKTIKHYKEGGMDEEQLRQSLTILNIGAYDTKVIENLEVKDDNVKISYDSVICIDEVYDINNIPVGFTPRTAMLDEEEESLYKKVKEELKKKEKGNK